MSAERTSKGESKICFPADYIVIDTETTGLSSEWDDIIEISALRVQNSQIVSNFSQLVNPGYKIDQFITDLTGITNDMLASAPAIKEVLPKFLDFVGDAVIVGHNVNFDINFIYDKSVKFLQKPFTNDFVDTLRMARKLAPDESNKLGSVASRYKIKVEKEHRALADCETTKAVFDCLKADALAKYTTEDEFAKQFKHNHNQKSHSEIVKELLENVDPANFDETHPLYGAHVCFTGTLEKMVRKDAIQLVLNLGGFCEASVNKKVNYLILGNNDYCSTIKDGKSTKHKKAEELKLKGQDIEILPEDVFYELIG